MDDRIRPRSTEHAGTGNEGLNEADTPGNECDADNAREVNHAPAAVNIIRDKTFNPELRRLVERVRDNEPGGVHAPRELFNNQVIGDEEFDMELYRLYYRARTLRDNLNVNISFNPFDLQSHLSVTDITEAVFVHMAEEMKAISYPSFGILNYDIQRKGFAPVRHTLDRFDASNIIISLRDGIFLEMFGASEGIIVEESAIRQDNFLAKQFMPADGSEIRPLYFAALSSLGEMAGKELATEGMVFPLPFLPSAILMVELPKGEGRRDTAEIHTALRRKIAIHAFLLGDGGSSSRAPFICDNVAGTYGVLEYLFSVFLLKKDCVCLSVVSKGKGEPGTGYLFKFLVAKTKRMLSSDSAIIHLLKNRLIFLAPSASIVALRELLVEFNRLFEGRFIMKEFRPVDFSDPRDIIQLIVLGT